MYIPNEVRKAAARAIADVIVKNAAEKKGSTVVDYADAALEAGLKVWPGMREMEELHCETISWVPWRVREWKYKFLHLPLIKEQKDELL